MFHLRLCASTVKYCCYSIFSQINITTRCPCKKNSLTLNKHSERFRIHSLFSKRESLIKKKVFSLHLFASAVKLLLLLLYFLSNNYQKDSAANHLLSPLLVIRLQNSMSSTHEINTLRAKSKICGFLVCKKHNRSNPV